MSSISIFPNLLAKSWSSHSFIAAVRVVSVIAAAAAAPVGVNRFPISLKALPAIIIPGPAAAITSNPETSALKLASSIPAILSIISPRPSSPFSSCPESSSPTSCFNLSALLKKVSIFPSRVSIMVSAA